MKVVRLIIGEIQSLFIFLVVRWPNSPFGYWIRRIYWRRITGVKNITVGRGAYLGDGSFIVFGDNLDIGENVELVADGVDGLNVFIGSNIAFARGVYLRSANHRFDDLTKLIMEQGHTSKKVSYKGIDYSVVIEDDSWIGANVIILSGARIGEGAVIGAGSVVTGIIPPYSIAVGSPARVISSRKQTRVEDNGS